MNDIVWMNDWTNTSLIAKLNQPHVMTFTWVVLLRGDIWTFESSKFWSFMTVTKSPTKSWMSKGRLTCECHKSPQLSIIVPDIRLHIPAIIVIKHCIMIIILLILIGLFKTKHLSDIGIDSESAVLSISGLAMGNGRIKWAVKSKLVLHNTHVRHFWSGSSFRAQSPIYTLGRRSCVGISMFFPYCASGFDPFSIQIIPQVGMLKTLLTGNEI